MLSTLAHGPHRLDAHPVQEAKTQDDSGKAVRWETLIGHRLIEVTE